MGEAPRYMDAIQASAYCSFSLSYLRKLTARMELPHIRTGRKVVYDRTLLDRWLQRRVEPRSWRP